MVSYRLSIVNVFFSISSEKCDLQQILFLPCCDRPVRDRPFNLKGEPKIYWLLLMYRVGSALAIFRTRTSLIIYRIHKKTIEMREGMVSMHFDCHWKSVCLMVFNGQLQVVNSKCVFFYFKWKMWSSADFVSPMLRPTSKGPTI
jgi:hypothetical protein